MKLTFVDRFAIKNLIPDQANIIKGMLFNSIAQKVNFTPEEIDRHELLNEETIINNITAYRFLLQDKEHERLIKKL